MKLTFWGGPFDGLVLDHGSPGWASVYAVKVNEFFYLVTGVDRNTVSLRYYEKQILPPGKIARQLSLKSK